jgi:SAM-dependent methyltransferase
MYEDLTAWLASRQWCGQVVGEIGGSNETLRRFLDGATYRQLPFPEYDVQNLYQIQNSQFDAMILDQTLEHIADPERALREVARVLKPGGLAIVTTPFLLPVHVGTNFGDYYRWTPQGMGIVLKRCGFQPEVRMWGSLKAAKALTEDMYMKADRAREIGLSLTLADSDPTFPVTVWAIAKNLKST